MRYFLDTEFIEDGKTIDLLSIGIVSEDGRELYLESNDADQSKANDWVKENVLPHLRMNQHATTPVRRSRTGIALEILNFVASDPFEPPEFWAYFADYDWVALCQLYGRMVDLPSGWPMFCRDLKQTMDDVGVPRSMLPEVQGAEHYALHDARWVRSSFELIQRALAGETYYDIIEKEWVDAV